MAAPVRSFTVPVTSPRSICAVNRHGRYRTHSKPRTGNREPANLRCICAFTFASNRFYTRRLFVFRGCTSGQNHGRRVQAPAKVFTRCAHGVYTYLLLPLTY